MDVYARPQELVAIGRRRRLNILRMGEGGPTVVLAAGFLGGTLDWGLVQPWLARRTRTVSFDTAGLGFSDPAAGPRTSSAIVADVRAALIAAEIPPPYVLVGHSAGGLRMHLWAATYPREVAGLVMVDSVAADWARRLPAMVRTLRLERAAFRRMRRAALAGALGPDSPDYRERVGLPRPMLSPAVNQALHEMWLKPSYLSAAIRESLRLQSPTEAELRADVGSLGALPLRVLSAGQADRFAFLGGPAGARRWLQMHDELAALSSRVLRTSVDCGHNIPVERPRAVVEAVEQVLAMIPAA